MATDAVERLYKLSVEGGQAITEMKRVAKATEDSAKHIKEFQKQFKDMKNTLLGGLTVAAIVTGFKGIVASMSEIVDTSAKLGVTTTELQEMRFAAQQSGVSAEALNTAIKKLQIGMQELGDPTSEQGRLLKQIGVQEGSVTKAIHKVADAYQRMGNESQKVAFITKTLGKSANELIPFLEGGSEALNKFNKEARELGIIIDQPTLDMFDAVGDNMDKMNLSFQAVGIRIAGDFLPAFMAISKAFLDASKNGALFTSMGKTLGQVAIYIAKAFIGLWTYLRAVGTLLGGLAAAATAFFTSGGVKEGARAFSLILEETVADTKAIGKEGAAAWDAIDASYKNFSEGGLPAVTKKKKDLNITIKDNTKELEKERKEWEKQQEILGKLKLEYEDLTFELTEVEKLERSITLGLVKYNAEQLYYARLVASLKDHNKNYEKSLKEVEEQEKKNAEAQQKYNDVLKAQEDAWNSLLQTIDPVLAKEEQHRLAVEQLNMQYGVLKMSTEEYEKRLKQIDKAFGPEKAVTALSIIDANFQAFFKNMENGTADVEDAFKRMVQSIIAQLLKLLAYEFIKSMFGVDLAKAGKAAKGAVFDVHGLVPFARGGTILSSPIMFPIAGGRMGLAGEAGPEGVFPLTRTSSGDLGVKAEQPIVNVNVVNNHPDASVSVQQSDDNSNIEIIIERTRRALSNDVRKGGSMFSSAIESTYALGRARG
jgi:hypothetical protein